MFRSVASALDSCIDMFHGVVLCKLYKPIYSVVEIVFDRNNIALIDFTFVCLVGCEHEIEINLNK